MINSNSSKTIRYAVAENTEALPIRSSEGKVLHIHYLLILYSTISGKCSLKPLDLTNVLLHSHWGLISKL